VLTPLAIKDLLRRQLNRRPAPPVAGSSNTTPTVSPGSLAPSPNIAELDKRVADDLIAFDEASANLFDAGEKLAWPSRQLNLFGESGVLFRLALAPATASLQAAEDKLLADVTSDLAARLPPNPLPKPFNEIMIRNTGRVMIAEKAQEGGATQVEFEYAVHKAEDRLLKQANAVQKKKP
jgi:hypothetical protein